MGSNLLLSLIFFLLEFALFRYFTILLLFLLLHLLIFINWKKK